MTRKSIRSSGNDDDGGTLGVVLGFDHPSGDPEEITRRLGVQPSMAAMAGSHYVNVQGDELPARHRSSKWRLYRHLSTSARELDDISSVISDIIKILEQHADFVRLVAEDGRVWIWLQLNGADHRVIGLNSDLLGRMAELHVDFDMEVFPHGLG